MELSDREVRVLRLALLEVLTGSEVQEWEYPIRLGLTKDEARDLLERLSVEPSFQAVPSSAPLTDR
jgi:hypothetical protein